jgi:hypothetical protein
MRVSCVLAAWLLQRALGDVVSTVWPVARQALDAQQTATDLSSHLSKDADILFPSDPEWKGLLARASYPRIDPGYYVIVEVATEADVQKTVSYAYKRNIPFLVVSGTHGWPSSLNKLKGGIQINLRKLNSTIVDKGGKTATIGGGALQWEATKALYSAGKQTVTGLCECVSVIGPLLGGGHSYLQNQHGFALDNLESARVVLANGTLAEASPQNPDLFWALRGAGHNFGVVTSFQMKVYDIPDNDQWTIFSFMFKQDQLEALYKLVNTIDDPATRPGKLMLTGVFVRIPDMDADKPMVGYTVSYEGTLAETEKYAAPFKALKPVNTTLTTNVKYVDLYTVNGNDVNSPVCRKNNNILGAGASLPVWDIPGLRKAYEIFANATADPRFSTSATLLENYGINVVRNIDAGSTALPAEERTYPILASAIMWYEGDDAKTHEDARVYATGIRNALYHGVDARKQKRHTYVNYAFGDESLQEVYGYEQWRLDKLKTLKKAYDPKNAFGYYVPIV